MPQPITDPSSPEPYMPPSFGEWLKRQRKRLDLTQEELAKRVGCARVTIRKVEADEMRPSKQLAALMAQALDIPSAEREAFVQFARGGQVSAERKPPQPEPATAALYQRTFVGRVAELQQAQRAFDGIVAGQGTLLMVVGEPGVGKTALCEQLANYVSQHGGQTLVGHCYEEGSLSLPYLPFVEAMRTSVLAREPGDLRRELGAVAGDVARLVPTVTERLGVEPRAGTGSADDLYRLLHAVSSFLRNAAAAQPLVIVLEDLHWADHGTLDMLLHVARNLAGSRLLVVGTYRDAEVDRAHPLSSALAELRRGHEFGRVLLRGLSVEDVQQMLTRIAGQDVSRGLAEAVHRQTEGNPLFVEEVIRYLAEAGLITRDAERGRWRATSSTPIATHIPEGLRDVIGKRLSRLSPECNRLLAIAAVIGRECELDTLQAVAGQSEEQLLDGLEEALRVGVLEEQALTGRVHYHFTHALIRQTVYEELIAPRRIRLHQQVARALEAQYASRRQEHAAELAEHFSQSSDPADLAKAIEYGELAAQRAMSVYAYGEGVHLLERALQVQEVLNPDDKLKRCDLLLALGHALMPAGHPMRAADKAAHEALALAEALGDRNRCSQACRVAIEALTRFGAATMWGSSVFNWWTAQADQYAAPGTVERVWADIALSLSMRPKGLFAQSWKRDLQTWELAVCRRGIV